MKYISVLVLLLLAAPQDKEKKPLKTWSGLINDKALKKVEVQTDAKGFAVGLIRDAKAWGKFAKAAGRIPRKPKVDWKKQIVVFIILKAHTNRVSFKKWTPPKDGTAELLFNWSLIEPYYDGLFPALVHPVSREDLKKITVKYTSGGAAAKKLADITVRKPKK